MYTLPQYSNQVEKPEGFYDSSELENYWTHLGDSYCCKTCGFIIDNTDKYSDGMSWREYFTQRIADEHPQHPPIWK